MLLIDRKKTTVAIESKSKCRFNGKSSTGLLEYEPRTFKEKILNMDAADRICAFVNPSAIKGLVPRRMRSAIVNIVTVKNPVQMLMVEEGKRKSANARFEDGHVMPGITQQGFHLFETQRHFAFHNYPARLQGDSVAISFDGRQLSLRVPESGIGDITSVFFRQVYRKLGCENSTVVDIGAHIGDSAIYFAARGADRVIALEPFKYSLAIARENIGKNGFSGKITLVNAGIAAKSGKVRLDPDFMNDTGSRLYEFEVGEHVPLLALADLVSQYSLRDARGGAVLKLDCEGAEYPAILASDSETLRAFREILVEYHFGYRNLAAKLGEAGFGIEHLSPPQYSKSSEGAAYFIGFIYARRRD